MAVGSHAHRDCHQGHAEIRVAVVRAALRDMVVPPVRDLFAEDFDHVVFLRVGRIECLDPVALGDGRNRHLVELPLDGQSRLGVARDVPLPRLLLVAV